MQHPYRVVSVEQEEEWDRQAEARERERPTAEMEIPEVERQRQSKEPRLKHPGGIVALVIAGISALACFVSEPNIAGFVLALLILYGGFNIYGYLALGHDQWPKGKGPWPRDMNRRDHWPNQS